MCAPAAVCVTVTHRESPGPEAVSVGTLPSYVVARTPARICALRLRPQRSSAVGREAEARRLVRFLRDTPLARVEADEVLIRLDSVFYRPRDQTYGGGSAGPKGKCATHIPSAVHGLCLTTVMLSSARKPIVGNSQQ